MDYTKEIDYSSLSQYMACPRKFFFRYVLHLRPDTGKSIDLIFGSAWHRALEFGYKALNDIAEAKNQSMEGFREEWESSGGNDFDQDRIFPKNLGRAYEMLDAYWDNFYQTDLNYEHIGSEIMFTIPLGDNLPDYIGRMDHVMADEHGLVILEHKTSKYFNEAWLTGFLLSFQPDGYITAAKLLGYPTEPEVVINGALCQKTKIDFIRHTIKKTNLMIDRFLSDVGHYCRKLNTDLQLYTEWCDRDESNDPSAILPYFRRNTTHACTAYFRPCEYADHCQAKANPAIWRNNPPIGFTVSEWHPNNLNKKSSSND